MNKPLAERMRPKTLEEYLSQQHLVGSNGILTHHIKQGIIPSLILWGPPGTGKTTLANIIATSCKRTYYKLSAIDSGVKNIREIIDKAKKSTGLFANKSPIVFIDEIHRFSKSQQDSLLAAVEKGWITLIGATTENPSFEIIPALLSRCQVYILNSFDKQDLITLIHRALKKDEILSKKEIILKQTDALLQVSGGDARRLLNILELLIGTENSVEITDKMVLEKVQKNSIHYDKTGEQHYDIISAFIKSIRGSDPNASVYWLARMIEGGENLKFIARRMVILASEDIGNANPTALILANNTFQAVSVVGNPESRIILSQCAIYLSNSLKSNACYLAIEKAQNLVQKTGNLSVPLHLRNAPTKLMKDLLNYGKNYQYAHNHQNNFVNQEFFPQEISGTKLYEPNDNPRENQFREILKNRWKEKYEY